MTEPAISIAGLRKHYGDLHAVDGLDLEIPRGEVFALLGPNGAGKSTTVEILEGFRQRTAGDVRVLGADPQGAPQGWRSRVGIMLQGTSDRGALTAREALRYAASLYPDPRDVDETLAAVGLTDKANAKPATLSGGQRRRLDVAQAVIGRPELVFLDEPTTGFDPEARRRFWTLIESLRGDGTTILLTTHYLDEAERLADRIAILRSGRIELAGTTQEVAARAGLSTRISFITPSALRRGQVALPDGIDLAVRGPLSVCRTDNAAVTLRRLLDWALENRLGDLDGLAVAAPSLEDTYLQLTGPDPEIM
jgi:ABC-2 type transport system ATP-binding protein